MKSLYGLIIFLKHYTKPETVWIVENVKGWYKHLIKSSFRVGRHYFWSNVKVGSKEVMEGKEVMNLTIKQLSQRYDINYDLIKSYDGFDDLQKRQVLRNCLDPEHGKYIYIIGCLIEYDGKSNENNRI